mmetsp:Transcript_129142/g.257823  ORF Transcript_129142/g.257823 Transcript_129142/m.257823 type:complete len:474 (-) Transcript_129142:36-1457(-)
MVFAFAPHWHARLDVCMTQGMQAALEMEEDLISTALMGDAPRLQIRESPETEWTDNDMILQEHEARRREEVRWQEAKKAHDQSANDVPFPVPLVHELCMRQWCVGPLPGPLQLLYSKLGSWELTTPTVVREAIQLRAAAPMLLAADPRGSEPPFTIEASEWHHIFEAKRAERSVWGCFDDAPFELRGCAIGTDAVTQLDVDALSLRSEIHADATIIDTVVESVPVWGNDFPRNVVNAVPMDVWKVNASGGFCLRATRENDGLRTAAPDDEWLCAICLDENVSSPVSLTCGHMFHARCIHAWFSKSARCPLCRRRCRHGPALINPPMNFEFVPWCMLPESVITQDITLAAQDRVEEARQSQPQNADTIQARCQRLADRFGSALPSSAFFEEVVPDEHSIGPAVVEARSQQYKENAKARFEKLEPAGSNLTVWPMNGRWPVLPVAPEVSSRRAALTARLATRHHSLSLAMQEGVW